MLGKLIALTKNGEEKESLPVVNLHFFIGSDLFCDLRINHKDIAAQHCLITSQKNKPALIRNLSRTVPTLVNSTEIGSSDVELKDSDIIAIRHKNYKWCYDSPSKPSTSSQTSFVVTSKNRKSWPLFKNKLVAVVTPQRRDEQNEVLPKKRRGTIAEENISKSKSTPKVLAIKSGLRATNKQTFGKRKSSLKNAQKRSSVERTPKVLPSLNRKSVKFLDTSAPRSRLGTRGRKSSSYATPYKCTPAKQKLSVYSTPPSSLKYDKKKPIKSILKTPSSSSTTPTKEEKDEIHLTSTSGILTTPLSNTPEVNLHGSSLLENDLLQTPVKEIQPEIVMRSSKRKAAIIRSPPSTPKSVIKKRKSPEEKSIEASERAAKKLKKGPPHAIDKKKRAALLQCHRKSLTPHPVARSSGKFITSFPSSFSSRLETNSPTRIIVSPKFNNSGKSESLKSSTDLLTPTVIKYSSLGKRTDSKLIQPSTTASQEKIKPRGRKSSHKSISKTSPIVRKFTRASRAAQISNNLPQKMEATDVLSALDLSRRWPSPSQGDSSSHDVSNLSGFKKLFSVDKTLDVRELFLETNSELDNTTEKSFQSPSESHLGRVSRRSALLKGKQSADEEELMHSFQSEGAQDLPCSDITSSSVDTSLGRRTRSSKRNLETSQLAVSTSFKKRSRSVPSLTDDLNTQAHRQSTRSRGNSIILNKTDKDSSAPSTLPDKTVSDDQDIVSPIIEASSNVGRRRRTSKLSVGPDNSQLEKSIGVKKRSRSLPSLGDQVTPKQASSILEDIALPKRSGRKGFDSILLNKTPENSSSTTSTMLDKTHSVNQNNTTPITEVSSNTSVRRSRPSKVSVSPDHSSLRKSTAKLSQSLPPSSSDQITPKQTSNVVEDIGRSTRSSRKVDHNTSIGRRGRLSKLSIRSDDSQFEKSIIEKKRSRSLPSSSHDQITPKQTSSIVEDIGRPRRSSRKGDDRMLNLTNVDILSTSPSKLSGNKTVSDKPDNATPIIKISSLNVTGRRGRPSNLSVDPGNTELQKSTIAEKSSLSLTSSSIDQITPKQTSSIVEDIVRSTRTSKKGDSSININKNPKHSSSTPTLPDKAVMDIQDAVTPIIKTSLNKTGRRGRSSKLSIGSDNSQLEESTYKKKRSRSLPCSSNDQITPKQTLSIVEDGRSTRSGKKGDSSIILNKTPKHSSSTPALPDKAVSDVQDDVTPMIKTSLNNTGRRGRSSKLSIGSDNSQLEESTYKKKRSRSLPSSSNDQITPKQTLSIVEDGRYTRSGKKGDSSIILSKTPKHSSTPALPDKAVSDVQDDVTPMIKTSLNNTGRRGRSSKLSIGSDISTLEESTYKKKRSRSLPSSSKDQITPKQTSIIVGDIGHSTRSFRKGDDSIILSNTNKDPLCTTQSTFPITIHDQQNGATPFIESSSSTTIGRRGRPSKLNVGLDNSQLEKSTTVKKRSQSLTSSGDQITPKQISNTIEVIGRFTRSSKTGDTSTVLNKTLADTSSATPSRLSHTTFSGKQESTTPIIEVSSNTSVRRGRPSKLSVSSDHSSLEKSTAMKKLSQSLPSSSDDQMTLKKTSSQPRQSSRIGDDSKILNKINANTSISSPLSLIDRTPSDEEVYGTPDISTLSAIKTSVGKRGRPSKLSGGLDNSELKSTSVKKLSQSLSYLSVKTSVGRQSIISKSCVGPDNSQLEKSIMKKRSRSLPSSIENQTTPKQTSSILESFGRLRRSSRKGDDGKILNKTLADTPSSSPSTLPDKAVSRKEDGATPNITTSSLNNKARRGRPAKLAVSTKVKNEKLPLIESNASQNLTSRTSLQIISGEPSATLSTYTPSLDHIEDIPAISRRKSRKRNVEEVSPESGPLNPISFHGSSDDNISSLAKKRVKISNSDSFPVFSDSILNNKGTNFLDTNEGNSKTFGAFSSTPIVTKNPYIIDSCGEKYRSRCKFRNMQSPMGLSPITGEADSSKEGMSVKSSDSSHNKRGRPKKHPVISNETISSPSLPKKGRPAKILKSNLPVSGKRTAGKISESVEAENTSLLRGRSVVKDSDSSPNKKGKSRKNSVNNTETIASPSLTLPKRGRRAKIQESVTTVSVEKTARKTSANVADENTYLRRGRSVVKNSDSSNQKSEPKKDPVNSNQTIASTSSPKRGRSSNKVQAKVTTDSRKNPNKKGSEEIEEVQTNVRRRGRSAVKEQSSVPDKRKRTNTESESNTNFNLDSTLPKKGRSAKRKDRNDSESKENITSLPLQKRQSSVVENSNLSPVKRGKSKKNPSTKNVAITSPSSPNKGKSAKIQEAVTASVKGANNKVSKSIDDQNMLSSQRRGRSAAVKEDSLDRKGKPKEAIEKNNVAQISSLSKKGRPAILENVSPRSRGRSVASKQTSTQLSSQATAEKTSKLPGRRGNLASSPKPEIRKVSDRSKGYHCHEFQLAVAKER
ncbi:unnamed protein product [Nezara viridula]|uniref:FHA domain-containing protein n=1 Tax=Nezara viridula TaxID=85310 RepID=A0A9P0HMF9_NEZVI|nr:unnamed protein product [Nezara viridula]